MNTQRLMLAVLCSVACLPATTASGEGPLPKFTYQGTALHPKDLTFAPTGELERASLIKMEGRIKNPLGKYYLYYSPHAHLGVGVAYSDSITGPWKEYEGNPVIKDAAIPDIRWIEADGTGKFHLWAHRKNAYTEMWTSADGLHFEHHSTSIDARNIGTRNATYTRAYPFPLERYGNKYIMLYSGFIEGRGIRCVWLAHSQDGATWTQEKTPLVEPIDGENNDIYGPSLLQWQGRNYIVYQDHTAYRGGNVKYVELDAQLNPVGAKGERHLLIDPAPDSPVGNRFRGGEFYREGDTLYLYCSAGEKPRAIAYASAKVEAAKPAVQPDAATRPAETHRGEGGARPPTGANARQSDRENVGTPASNSLDRILAGLNLETVYETMFDQPIQFIREDALTQDGKFVRKPPEGVDWVLEGPGECEVASGRLHIRNKEGHCVLWNTREFPASFVAEWDFQHHHPQGLAIVFFAAQNAEGGRIFTPGLPQRGGRFGAYTHGKIHCYHTSYFATDEDGVPRGDTHLKKNHGDVSRDSGNKVAEGPSALDGKAAGPHRIRLAKLGNRIILEVDGKISIDWTDRGEKGGAPYTGGQIGLRQMAHTIEGSYGGLRIQQVKPEEGTVAR